MIGIDDSLGKHMYVCTIALLPDVDEEQFETQMVQEVMPKLHAIRRNFDELRLEHRLLKDEAGQRADRYVWQIRVLSFRVISGETDHNLALTAIDEDVRGALTSMGIPVSVTFLREIGEAMTP